MLFEIYEVEYQKTAVFDTKAGALAHFQYLKDLGLEVVFFDPTEDIAEDVEFSLEDGNEFLNTWIMDNPEYH